MQGLQASKIQDVRQTQVQEAMGKAHIAAEQLSSLIESLENRLTAVTQPQGPTAEGANKQPPRPVLVPVAETLDRIGDSLAHSARRIDSLLSRLEL